MKRIKIILRGTAIKAEILNTITGNKIYNALPLSGKATQWGYEIYFPISVDVDTEPGAKEEVEIGDLAYWQPGKMFCIFFGQTPMSTSSKPRTASEVNVFGRIIGDVSALHNVQENDIIKIEIDSD